MPEDCRVGGGGCRLQAPGADNPARKGATSSRQTRQISCDNKDWNEDKNQVRSAESRPPLLTDLGSFYTAVLRVPRTFCHGTIKT